MGEPAKSSPSPSAGRRVGLLVVHCSATPDDRTLFGPNNTPTPVETINEWHRARGFKRSAEFMARQNPGLDAIGYHFVIYRNGGIATGRHLDEVGAHVAGFNSRSIGVCMVGTSRYTRAQWDRLADLVRVMRKRYPGLRLCGHRDLSPDQNKNGIVEPFEWLKTCPGFDVEAWEKNGPAPENIAEE